MTSAKERLIQKILAAKIAKGGCNYKCCLVMKY